MDPITVEHVSEAVANVSRGKGSPFSDATALARTRRRQAIAILALAAPLPIALMAAAAYRGELGDLYVLPALILLIAGYAAWDLIRKRIDPLTTRIETIPLAHRVQMARQTLIVCLAIAALIACGALWYLFELWFFIPVLLYVLAIQIVHVLITDTRVAQTPAVAAAAGAASIQTQPPDHVDRTLRGLGTLFTAIEQHWWLYCPVAGLFFYLAYLVGRDPTPDSGLWAVLLVLAGVYVARKAFLVLVVLLILAGVAWLFFGAVAALPVSVAVIIGAIIIATALRR